jgi:hypothetical protein
MFSFAGGDGRFERIKISELWASSIHLRKVTFLNKEKKLADFNLIIHLFSNMLLHKFTSPVRPS